MSFFGKNIKKIRSLKKLSQQSFADLFEMKRATVGAYEEGRSEPKIDTIIKVANYFSISIDAILTKELTVNELLNFKSHLTLNTDNLQRFSFPSIPFVGKGNIADFVLNFESPFYVNQLTVLQLPVSSKKEFIAFEIQDLVFSKSSLDLATHDIAISERIDDLSLLEEKDFIFTILNGDLILREIESISTRLLLSIPGEISSKIKVKEEDLKVVWRVNYVFYKRLLSNNQEGETSQRLDRIEKILMDLSTNKKKDE